VSCKWIRISRQEGATTNWRSINPVALMLDESLKMCS